MVTNHRCCGLSNATVPLMHPQCFQIKSPVKSTASTMSRALLLSSLVEAGWGHRRQRVWGPVFLFTHVFSLLLCQWDLKSGCLAGLFMKGHQT